MLNPYILLCVTITINLVDVESFLFQNTLPMKIKEQVHNTRSVLSDDASKFLETAGGKLTTFPSTVAGYGFQLEEHEDCEMSLTHLHLEENGSIEIVQCTGPIHTEVSGKWRYEPKNGNLEMLIKKTFGTSLGTEYNVTRKYVGNIEEVLSSTIIVGGGIRNEYDGTFLEDDIDIGYFKMIHTDGLSN